MNTSPDQKIWLNLNKTSYYPGDQINGFLYLELQDSLADALILLKLKSNKLTKINEETSQKAHKQSFKPQTNSFPKKKLPQNNCFSETLIGDMKKLPILPMGKLKIPIVVLLPLNLCASTNVKFKTGGEVRVKYTLCATLRYLGGTKKVFKEVVINNFSSNENSKFEEKSKLFLDDKTEVNLSVPIELMSCLPKGRIMICVQPKKVRFRHKGIIDISLHTDLRQSDLDILKVETILEREVLIQNENNFLFVNEILAKRTKGKIERGRKRRNLQILLPFSCGKNEQSCTSESLGVKYQVRLTFRMADCCMNSPSVLIPLYIEKKQEIKIMDEEEEDEYDLILGAEPFILTMSLKSHKKAQDGSTRTSLKDRSRESIERLKFRVFDL